VVIVGFCAPSKTGKTTFLEYLIPQLLLFNIQVGVIKHCHHELTDHPKSDSKRLIQAGGNPVIATMDRNIKPSISSCTQCDLILVEGFRSAQIPSFILQRGPQDHTWTPPQNVIDTLDLIHFDQALQKAQTRIHLLLFGKEPSILL